MSYRCFFAFFGLLILFLASAGCSEPGAGAERLEAFPATHWFDLGIGERTVRVQLAISPDEMARGLMERMKLEPDDGMLFVYRQPMQASFWMKNTPLPLDIGFFNTEGVLLEVYPMFPYDETSVRSRSDRVLFALEMNQGWFSRNKVRPGAALDREVLREAVRARGFDPAEFGL